MPPRVDELLQEYLDSLGKTEIQVRESFMNEGGAIEEFRGGFFEFCSKRGVALKNYSIFESDDFEHLRKVVLSVPKSVDYDEYWNRASAGTAKIIIEELGITPSSKVLDFGCGVGRVARCVVEQTPCDVVGVDISKSMLETASRYVGSSKFKPMLSADFHRNPQQAGPFTAAYALIVLQHCEDPEAELKAIRSACAPGARFFVIGSHTRFVPTTAGWHDDGIDIRKLIDSLFIIEKEIDLSAIPSMRFDPNQPPSSQEQNHYTLVARVP